MRAAPPKKLIDAVADRCGIRRSVAKVVLTEAFEEIKARSARGNLMIRGFGTFHTATRAGCVRPLPSDPTRTITVPSTKRLALRAPSDESDES